MIANIQYSVIIPSAASGSAAALSVSIVAVILLRLHHVLRIVHLRLVILLVLRRRRVTRMIHLTLTFVVRMSRSHIVPDIIAARLASTAAHTRVFFSPRAFDGLPGDIRTVHRHYGRTCALFVVVPNESVSFVAKISDLHDATVGRKRGTDGVLVRIADSSAINGEVNGWGLLKHLVIIQHFAARTGWSGSLWLVAHFLAFIVGSVGTWRGRFASGPIGPYWPENECYEFQGFWMLDFRVPWTQPLAVHLLNGGCGILFANEGDKSITFWFSSYHIFDYPAVTYFPKRSKCSSQSLRFDFRRQITDKNMMMLRCVNFAMLWPRWTGCPIDLWKSSLTTDSVQNYLFFTFISLPRQFRRFMAVRAAEAAWWCANSTKQ